MDKSIVPPFLWPTLWRIDTNTAKDLAVIIHNVCSYDAKHKI